MKRNRHPLSSARVRRGFSFVELMFAIIILGIGFILVAAVFPVGLSQAKSTLDESVAASVARGAASYLEKIATDGAMPLPLANTTSTMPATGNVFIPLQFRPNGQAAAEANMIQATDPRFAWVALYRRTSMDSKIAQVIIVVTQSSSTYSSNDFDKDPSTGLRQLEPRLVLVDIVNGTPSDVVTISPTTGAGAVNQTAAAATGGFLIITSDNLAAPNDTGRMNGHIYRLGARVGPNQFNLAPGYEFSIDRDPDGPSVTGPPASGLQTDITGLGSGAITPTPTSPAANAYIIGRTRTGPGDTNADFDSGAQDVAVYTTFINIK